MKKSKLIPLIIVLAVILILPACLNQPASQENKNQTATPKTEQPDTNLYSMTEISVHDNANDCWLLISGRVYDVTNFINSHPGGKSMLQGCGQESTQLFETRPMGSGTPHSSSARALLNDYYIGNLKSNNN